MEFTPTAFWTARLINALNEIVCADHYRTEELRPVIDHLKRIYEEGSDEQELICAMPNHLLDCKEEKEMTKEFAAARFGPDRSIDTHEHPTFEIEKHPKIVPLPGTMVEEDKVTPMSEEELEEFIWRDGFPAPASRPAKVWQRAPPGLAWLALRTLKSSPTQVRQNPTGGRQEIPGRHSNRNALEETFTKTITVTRTNHKTVENWTLLPGRVFDGFPTEKKSICSKNLRAFSRPPPHEKEKSG